MENNFRFFKNDKCEYFPCHKIENLEDFNCLFCYCPLYSYNCQGNFKLLENGIKDCSECLIPHRKDSYKIILNRLSVFQKI